MEREKKNTYYDLLNNMRGIKDEKNSLKQFFLKGTLIGYKVDNLGCEIPYNGHSLGDCHCDSTKLYLSISPTFTAYISVTMGRILLKLGRRS